MKNYLFYIIRSCVSVVIIVFSSLYCCAQNADINLLRDINKQRTAPMDKVMTGLTNSVYPISGIVAVTELIVGYAEHDKMVTDNGWQTIAGLGVNTILTFGLKDVVNRARPYVTYTDINPYRHNTDASFPSGHTSYSFFTASSLSLCYPKWYVIVPSYLWAASVGYSRMYLGMHYPTDVLAGAAIGAGSAWLAYQGNKWVQHRKSKRRAVKQE